MKGSKEFAEILAQTRERKRRQQEETILLYALFS